MNITKVLPDYRTTDLDCNKVKNYLTSVLQTVLGVPAYRSSVTTRSIDNSVEFSFYLPMIDNNINGMLNKDGSIVVDKLDNNIIVATLRTGSKSYLIKDGEFIECRENGDTFVKYNDDLFLVTSYGHNVYSSQLNMKVSAIVNADGIPYGSLKDAFVIVKLNEPIEFHEGLNGIKYLSYLFGKTDLPEYTRITGNWLTELFK